METEDKGAFNKCPCCKKSKSKIVDLCRECRIRYCLEIDEESGRPHATSTKCPKIPPDWKFGRRRQKGKEATVYKPCLSCGLLTMPATMRERLKLEGIGQTPIKDYNLFDNSKMLDEEI